MNETGMALSRRFWTEVLEPALRREFPALLPRLAAGLAGNGSECFGFDDAYSRDHDWGVEVFLWLTDADADCIPVLAGWKRRLLEAHPEFPARVRAADSGDGGVMTCGTFYRRLTGREAGPQSVREWFTTPEDVLAMAANGAVFFDGPGQFSAVRERLLHGRPEDLRRKRIAARCMMLAQTGQYNLGRSVRRRQFVTAAACVSRFVEDAIWMTFLLNDVYQPYYKWAYSAMCRLPRLAGAVGPLLEELTALGGWSDDVCLLRQSCVDRLCALFADALRQDGLSRETDPFLAVHGRAVQASITDPLLASLPPQVG